MAMRKIAGCSKLSSTLPMEDVRLVVNSVRLLQQPFGLDVMLMKTCCPHLRTGLTLNPEPYITAPTINSLDIVQRTYGLVRLDKGIISLIDRDSNAG